MTNPDQIMHIDNSRSFKSLNEIIEFLGAEEPEEGYEEDYSSNSPCDFSGYCAGASCPHYFECILGK